MWVNLNNLNEVLDDFGSWCNGGNSWCDDCQDHTEIEEVETIAQAKGESDEQA